MKHQTKELSISIDDERHTRWCRRLYYRLARLSHFVMYVFFLLLVLLIAYWLRLWPRYGPISTNLSLTGTSARLNNMQISPYAKHGVFHRLRSHNVRPDNHHRGRFIKKLVNTAQLSEDGEKPLKGYGVQHRNPWNKAREWKEESFHRRYTEDDDGSDQLSSSGIDHEIRGEGRGIVEEDRPRKMLPDKDSDVTSEKGPDIDDDVDRQVEVRRSEGRLHVRKHPKKESRGSGGKGKRPVMYKKRLLPEHVRTHLYGFEGRKTKDSNNANGELNIAAIDEASKTKDIHEKNKYHGNSIIRYLKPKANIKKMNMSDQRQVKQLQISSTGKLDKYTNNIKKIILRGNGGKEVTVKQVPGQKTSVGSNSWKYKANIRSSVLQKTTGWRKVAGVMKGTMPKVNSLLNSKANLGGRGTLKRMEGSIVNFHHTTQRSGRAQGMTYQNMQSKDYLAKQRKINRQLGKNIGILSTPNVSRKSQSVTVYGDRKDRGHKPGPIIKIQTYKVRNPAGNVNSPVKTFVTKRSNIALFNNAQNAISNQLKHNSKRIAPRPEKQHVVVN